MKMSKIIMSTIFAGALIVSCNDNKKEKDKVMEEEMETTSMNMDNKTMNDKAMNDAASITTREYAMKDGTEVSYDYSEDGVLSLSDWNDYNTLSYEMIEIEKVDFKATNERVTNLKGVIDNLGESVPVWLKNEEVMEDIADIQKEYNELTSDPNASDDERKENLEELSEQFADFREELNETIQKYFEINKEAVEEFNEEMKDGDYEDAIEEYNEEIKKKEKIADYEENTSK